MAGSAGAAFLTAGASFYLEEFTEGATGIHCSAHYHKRGVNIVFRLSRPGLHHGDRPAPVALHSSASVSSGI
jgi:hypothetical protein